MTDYNDGNWHEWYGGECPVHQETEVEAFHRVVTSPETFRKETRHAKNWMWNAPVSSIVLFRVVKPYREPRVIWVNEYGDGLFAGHVSKESAEDASIGYPAPLRTAVRYVEQPE